MSTIPELLKHARESMQRAVENTKKEFGAVRTGKASPHLLDTIRVPAYGNMVPLNQVGMVSSPEPRMLTVTPFDKGLTQAIEKALRDSDLGINPQTQGNLIRIPLPPLSQERRKEMVKLVHKLGEEGRVAVRHARTDARDRIKKTDGVSEDDKKHAEKDLQKLHDDYIAKIDAMVKSKEVEILEV